MTVISLLEISPILRSSGCSLMEANESLMYIRNRKKQERRRRKNSNDWPVTPFTDFLDWLRVMIFRRLVVSNLDSVDLIEIPALILLIAIVKIKLSYFYPLWFLEASICSHFSKCSLPYVNQVT